MIDDFEKEKECYYKGETYSVRDNGAVLRHPKIDKKPRPTDNIWTFGKYNAKTGYAEIAGERIHRIVATAFHGEAPSPQHVVDHIDTNRRNNRPENLRWVTKLENILLNTVTVRRIELACGSIEEFLKDPSKLRQSYVDRDFEWMRAVSKEEAAASLERLQNWAKSDKPTSGGSIGEWIYNRNTYRAINEDKKINVDFSKSTETNSSKIEKTAKEEQKSKLERISKNNPFSFPRPESNSNDTVIMYTNSKMIDLLKAQLESEKRFMLPDIVLPTAGKGIIIQESWLDEFEKAEDIYGGRSHAPKSIILQNEDRSIALLIRMKSIIDEKEINRLKNAGFDIVEIDMSWATKGVTEAEMKYILQTDITKKKWINNKLINDAQKMLLNISESIDNSGQGVAHSYYACPFTSESIQDMDCWYCNYRTASNPYGIQCFGKSGVQTYQDLLSIIDVKKEDNKIISISYTRNGKTETKNFDKEVQLPGKTIFQLWDERTNNEVIVHNIYSDWYVLIEEDPMESFKRTGEVYGKLGRSIEALEECARRSIFSFDSYCWMVVK